ncbi:MAG: hypothetical protein MK138_07675, partial [Planctomycetes bacterium]|nr:hypothetical protein [Planctomycetota bacterium]
TPIIPCLSATLVSPSHPCLHSDPMGELMELRPAPQRPLSEVRSAVSAMLLNIARDAAQEEFYRGLRARRKVFINLELLEKLERPPTAD